MQKFYQVISNLNIGGTLHKAGSFIGEEFAGIEALVEDGVLRVVKEAKNIEDAAAIVAAEKEKTGTAPTAPAKPKNTWGPKKDDEKPAEVKTEVPAAPAAEGTNTEVKTDVASGTEQANLAEHVVGDACDIEGKAGTWAIGPDGWTCVPTVEGAPENKTL